MTISSVQTTPVKLAAGACRVVRAVAFRTVISKPFLPVALAAAAVGGARERALLLIVERGRLAIPAPAQMLVGRAHRQKTAAMPNIQRRE
jgi:hypothetical protein